MRDRLFGLKWLGGVIAGAAWDWCTDRLCDLVVMLEALASPGLSRRVLARPLLETVKHAFGFGIMMGLYAAHYGPLRTIKTLWQQWRFNRDYGKLVKRSMVNQISLELSLELYRQGLGKVRVHPRCDSYNYNAGNNLQCLEDAGHGGPHTALDGPRRILWASARRFG